MGANITLKVDSLPEDAKLPKQAREIMTYLVANMKVGEAIDQKKLLENLDFHQEDNKVLETTPKQPISRIFQFYRKRLVDAGLLDYERTTAVKAPKKAKEDGGEEKAAPDARRKVKPESEATASA